MRYLIVTGLLCFCFACSSPKGEQTNKLIPLHSFPLSTKVNEIQVLGTHNSYAKPIDTNIINHISPLMSQMMDKYLSQLSEEAMARYKENHPNEVTLKEALSYDHPTFEIQLNSGIRSLEIDIYYDPDGDLYTQPAAYSFFAQKGIHNLLPIDTIGLSAPGFKVLHIPDIDFRSHYTNLALALKSLKVWSDEHPNHIPIFILVEAKNSGIPLFPKPTKVLPFDEQAFDQLDQTIFSIIGKDRMITPDQVKGNFSSLEEGVLAKNWPLLSESLGKFVFMLLPSTGGLSMETPYLNNRPSLEGRAMFLQSMPGKDHSAFLLLDNALLRQQDIIDAVQKGYLVRTRADIETYEAKMNDYSRANAAFNSGAQIISTDFFRAGNVYGTDYVVKIPSGKSARPRPF